MTALALRLFVFSCCVAHVAAMSWRIFVGREDCVTESIPENQLSMLRQSFKRRDADLPEKLNVAVAVGFLATNRYGGETRGTVDVTARSPDGEVIYTAPGVQEDTFNVVSRGAHHGWEVCFKIAHSEGVSQPLMIELTYFTVNMRALIGTEHEKSKETQVEALQSVDVDVESLAKSEDLGEMIKGLRSTSMQLTSMRHQIHHLKLRTDRHMRTVTSTHRRTLYWSAVVALVVVSASVVQVYAVRQFFNKTDAPNRV